MQPRPLRLLDFVHGQMGVENLNFIALGAATRMKVREVRVQKT
jgi:hypothetical protein